MAGVPLQTVVRHLRRVAASNGHAGPTDAQLLDRFVADRDQAAFELLLWRHGAMVLGLCRRILRHEQEAEDAFQATFLTLARKGRSLRGGAVAGWLHTVAYRVALAAKARADRRALHERPLTNTSTAYSPAFEGLQLYRAVVSMPVPADASRPSAGLKRKAENDFTVEMFWDAALRQNANVELTRPGQILVQPVESQYVPDLRAFFLQAATQNPAVPAKFKVGEIKIVDNTQIADDAIRERLGLAPGQEITAAELQQAEKKLQESRIFKQAPAVTVADPPGGAVKDIVITIQNK